MIATFIGHKELEITNELITCIKNIIIELILKGVNTFLFGSKSQFNTLCYDIVIKLKKEFPNIKLVYVRAEYDYSDDCVSYLLEYYDKTYFPTKVKGAGRISYVIRNNIMIDASDYVIMYFNPNYVPKIKIKKGISYLRKSGTRLAFDYAKHKHKQIINVYDIENN